MPAATKPGFTILEAEVNSSADPLFVSEYRLKIHDLPSIRAAKKKPIPRTTAYPTAWGSTATPGIVSE